MLESSLGVELGIIERALWGIFLEVREQFDGRVGAVGRRFGVEEALGG